MSRLRKWVGDLLFGMRLAVAGRRAWGRFALTAFGLGLGVAVLLAAASLPQVLEADHEREAQRPAKFELVQETQEPPTALLAWEKQAVGGVEVPGVLLEELSPDAPVPSGLQRIPSAGEVVVSPALARLLRSPEGAGLGPRLGGEVVATIGDAGLLGPGELLYYRGVDGLSDTAVNVGEVVDDYATSGQPPVPAELWAVLVLGVAALLVPVVVFVASTTRLAEAARQRRLAALRLVGAAAGQVRRMAAGEVLVGALLGVAFGWVLFAVARLVLEGFFPLGMRPFTSAVWPGWAAGTLITFGIPVLAAITAVGSMRRMIIEPLGVARRGAVHPCLRWWRAMPLVLGLAGLATAAATDSQGVLPFGGSVVLVLLGVALVLPWLVDRVVAGRTDASLAWQLAVRRLQLAGDSSVRSVSAVAVVLTGLIALQIMLASAESNMARAAEWQAAAPGEIEVRGSQLPGGDSLERSVQRLAAIPGAEIVSVSTDAQLTTETGAWRTVSIVDCSELARMVGPHQRCRDGDAFFPPVEQQAEPVREGAVWKPEWQLYGPPGESEVRWTVPSGIQPLREPDDRGADFGGAELLLTPGAAEGIPELAKSLEVRIEVRGEHAAAPLERVREVAVDGLAGAEVNPRNVHVHVPGETWLQSIRYGLLLGAVVVFVLIGCGLLVAATEQVQERRRHLAVLGAVGVPRSTLAWSVFLQNGVVMLIAAALALVIGSVMGALATSFLLGVPRFDVAGTLALVAMAAAAVLVVTAATLPSLKRALHPKGLRSE